LIDYLLVAIYSKSVGKISQRFFYASLISTLYFSVLECGCLFIFSFSSFFFNRRKAFKIAMKVTPTSANTASHIVAIPSAPIKRKIAFTTKAKIIFSHTITFVFLAIFIALVTAVGLS